MHISFRSERNFIALNCFIDGQGLQNYKLVKAREESPSNTSRYYVEKKEEIFVTILEYGNNRLYRLLFNIIVLIISFFGSNGEMEDFFSLKYKRAKLVLRIVSNNLEDEIDIRHIMKNPPFNVETIQSYDNFNCEIIYNGRFEGKYSAEENKIAGVEKKKKRKS